MRARFSQQRGWLPKLILYLRISPRSTSHNVLFAGCGPNAFLCYTQGCCIKLRSVYFSRATKTQQRRRLHRTQHTRHTPLDEFAWKSSVRECVLISYKFFGGEDSARDNNYAFPLFTFFRLLITHSAFVRPLDDGAS